MKFKGIAFISLILLFIVSCERKEEIQIGAILALSGEKSAYGISAKRGIELALELFNKNNKTNYKIVFEDSKGFPKDAVSAFEKIIKVEKVPVVIGPLSSTEVLAVSPSAQRNKIILFTPGASSPAISNAGDYIFRNVPSDIFEARYMASFVNTTLNMKSVAVLYVNNDYGLGVLNEFKNKYEHLGNKITVTESYRPDEKNFRSQLLSIKNSHPDGIYIVGYKELAIILNQAKELSIKNQFISTSLIEDPEIIKIAGRNADKVIFTTFFFDVNSKEKNISTFVQAFKKKYNAIPDGFSATAYDASNILLEIIKKVGMKSERIKNEIYKTKNYTGLLGKISFDQNGDVELPLKIKIIENKSFVDYTTQ